MAKAFKRISRGGVCPPGVFCLSSGVTVFLVILVVILVALGFSMWRTQQTVREVVTVSSGAPQLPPIHIVNEGGDNRYTRAPEPYRMWGTVPDLRGAIVPPGAVPINMPTRYYPEQFQQMGILKTPDQQILPLYGRRTGNSTDRYNYYTRTDTYNPVQIPLNYQKRNCMDDIGCNELLGGEDIKIHGLDKSAHVEVYKYDAPKYIPSLL